jgi:hypothetical protein
VLWLPLSRVLVLDMLYDVVFELMFCSRLMFFYLVLSYRDEFTYVFLVFGYKVSIF